MSTPHAVTSAFLSQCAAVTPNANGDGSVSWLGTTLWPRVAESGAWSFGTASGITMAGSVLDELKGATSANADGTFTNANGAIRALYLASSGACEPTDHPGPPPP